MVKIINTLKIGRNIAEAREAQQLTQEFVAEKLGLNVADYLEIENDRADIRLSQLETISNILSYHPADLIAPNQQSGMIKNIFVNQTGNHGVNINIQGIDQEQIRTAYKELYNEELDRIPKLEKLLKENNISVDF